MEERMLSKWTVTLAAAVVLTAPVLSLPASADDTVVRHMTDADALAAFSAPKAAPPATQISQHAMYQVQFVQRKQSGGVEQHMDWNEYFIVEDGDATFNYGGTSVNAKEMRSGEMMGESIANGAAIQVHKGDIVTIPAGTPHQMILAPGATIRYLDFKGHKD
jgi:mannose-6-phosphate isomerase-like protein (cupin superfamily)